MKKYITKRKLEKKDVLFSLLSVLLFLFILKSSDSRMKISAKETEQPKNPNQVVDFIFEFSNQVRSQYHLPLFVQNEKLQISSARHSQNMQRHDFYSHTDHKGRSPSQRVEEWFPELIGGIGENLAVVSGDIRKREQDLAQEFVNGWMNSPPHRKNMLNKDYRYLGVGVSVAPRKIYATQNFAELTAELISKYPRYLTYSKKIRMRFRYLSPLARETLLVFVKVPDKNYKAVISRSESSYSYYRGMVPVKVSWHRKGTEFSFPFTFDKGRGVYSILMGKSVGGEKMHSRGLEIKVP